MIDQLDPTINRWELTGQQFAKERFFPVVHLGHLRIATDDMSPKFPNDLSAGAAESGVELSSAYGPATLSAQQLPTFKMRLRGIDENPVKIEDNCFLIGH